MPVSLKTLMTEEFAEITYRKNAICVHSLRNVKNQLHMPLRIIIDVGCSLYSGGEVPQYGRTMSVNGCTASCVDNLKTYRIKHYRSSILRRFIVSQFVLLRYRLVLKMGLLYILLRNVHHV